jgi:hypothetical protein
MLMTSAPVTPTAETTALSEPACLVNTFIAPSKTFTDILRSARWWGPFLITVILSLVFVYAVDARIGFRKVTENQIVLSRSLGSALDVFMIWTLVLTALGISSIDKKGKLSTALIVVFSWYAVFALGSAAVAAAFS